MSRMRGLPAFARARRDHVDNDEKLNEISVVKMRQKRHINDLLPSAALHGRFFRVIERNCTAGPARFCVALTRSIMLDRLRQFIEEIVAPDGSGTSRRFDETDYRLAATALLIHVISLDGAPSEIERRKLRELLRARFALDDGATDRLIADATLVEGEAVDLYHFTSVIMRSVNEEGRLRIVEMMWEVVYADGQVSEFEDNVVWRAADLLGVSSRDRNDLKHRVAARQSVAAGGGSDIADTAP
jgi:uncharacterized tellurite resistance protein B-like protein